MKINKFITDGANVILDGDDIEKSFELYSKDITPDLMDKVRKEGLRVDYVISSASEDRHGDTINPKGWQYKSFMSAGANVVPFHNTASERAPVIGRIEKLWVDGDKFKATVFYYPEHVDAEANRYARIIAAGGLRAVSVGFMPIEAKESEKNSDGIDFIKQELLELSVVVVPANPDAVMDAGKSLERKTFLETLRKKEVKMTDENIKSTESQEGDPVDPIEEVKSEAEMLLKLSEIETKLSTLDEKLASIDSKLGLLIETDEPAKSDEPDEQDEQEEGEEEKELSDEEIALYIDNLSDEEKLKLFQQLSQGETK